jgi:hypothetical protein
VVPEEISGYQPLWINGEFLKKGLKVKAQGTSKDGNISLKVGDCNFKSLYVDAKYLDYEVLKTMTELAEAGFPVCLKRKPEEAGYFKHTDYEDLASRLVAHSSSKWSKTVQAKPLVSGDDLPYFWCRKDGDKYYIFFAHPVAKEFRYPVKYGQADTAETLNRTVTINIDGKNVEIQLAFKPYESLLLEVGSDGKYRPVTLPPAFL